MPGWGEWFMTETIDSCGEVVHTEMLDDASSSMAIVFLLFVFPSELTFWPFTTLAESTPSKYLTSKPLLLLFLPSRALLDWPYVQKRFPWGVAILFGGGFALAGVLVECGDYGHCVQRVLRGLACPPGWGQNSR